MKYNDNGEYKDIYIKTFDTLPVGAIVEYNGATIPDGWTDIGNNQIQKTSQYIEGGTQIASYSTNEVNTGVKWIDGSDIYRKVLTGTTADGDLQIDLSSLNIDYIVQISGTVGTANNLFPANFYYPPSYTISTRYYNGELYLFASSSYANMPFRVIIEYTKSS